MLPFLKKNQNKMITTLLDNRSGNRTEVSPDLDAPESDNHDQELEVQCANLLSGVERKSVQEIRDSLRAIFQHLSQPEQVESED